MHASLPSTRSISSRDGRVLFWEAGSGLVIIDALAVPSGSSYLPARPVTIEGRLPSWRVSFAILRTLDRWATEGCIVRFEDRVSPTGHLQVRISDGRSWMVLDTSAGLPVPAG